MPQVELRYAKYNATPTKANSPFYLNPYPLRAAPQSSTMSPDIESYQYYTISNLPKTPNFKFKGYFYLFSVSCPTLEGITPNHFMATDFTANPLVQNDGDRAFQKEGLNIPPDQMIQLTFESPCDSITEVTSIGVNIEELYLKGVVVEVCAKTTFARSRMTAIVDHFHNIDSTLKTDAYLAFLERIKQRLPDAVVNNVFSFERNRASGTPGLADLKEESHIDISLDATELRFTDVLDSVEGDVGQEKLLGDGTERSVRFDKPNITPFPALNPSDMNTFYHVRGSIVDLRANCWNSVCARRMAVNVATGGTRPGDIVIRDVEFIVKDCHPETHQGFDEPIYFTVTIPAARVLQFFNTTTVEELYMKLATFSPFTGLNSDAIDFIVQRRSYRGVPIWEMSGLTIQTVKVNENFECEEFHHQNNCAYT